MDDYMPSDDGESTRSPVTHFEGVSCAELARARYDIQFLIENTLVEGAPCLIGGAPKTLKTLIGIDMAISLATGTPFLGTLPVLQGARVGFMSGEGGMPVLQEYASRIAAARGIHLRDIAGVTFCEQLPSIASLPDLDGLAQFFLEYELRLVLVDSLYLAMAASDSGNIFSQGKILRNLNRVCGQAGVTVVLIHHLRKSLADPFTPPELVDLSWSGFAEFAGQWFLIGRREKYDGDQPGRHLLWLNVGGRAGHSALHALDIDEGSR